MEEIDLYLEEAQAMMDKSVEHYHQALAKIRAGKATPNMLDGIMVEYYGASTPIQQVATISTPDARTLVVKPFESKIIPDIEKAIVNSQLGLNPQDDGLVIRLNIPPLTGERREALVKQVKAEAEKGKVSIRNARKDTNDMLKALMKEGASKDLVKDAEEEVQKLTNKYVVKIDELAAIKEKDILTI